MKEDLNIDDTTEQLSFSEQISSLCCRVSVIVLAVIGACSIHWQFTNLGPDIVVRRFLSNLQIFLAGSVRKACRARSSRWLLPSATLCVSRSLDV